jgi:hypothetical protein
MGCQCAKSNEHANMNIESAPPKVAIEGVEEKKEAGEGHSKLLANETVNQSKISNSKMDESKGGKKKKRAKKTGENFDLDLLNLINKVRANPGSYAIEIEQGIAHIKIEEGKLVFAPGEGSSKIALTSGEEAFKKAADKMRALSPAPALEYREDLVIPVPEDPKDWKKQELITSALAKRRNENAGTYSEYLFNMDLGVADPAYSLLLQIVDDSPFKGKRCDNILNKEFKYCGISHQKQGKSKFCCYITFAK